MDEPQDVTRRAFVEERARTRLDYDRSVADFQMRRRFKSLVDLVTRTATELVHQAYLNVWQRNGRLPPPDRADAYITVAIKNAIEDYARERSTLRRDANRCSRLGENAAAIAAATEEVDATSNEELLRAIEKLAITEPLEATVIFKKFFEGLTIRTIADELRLPRSTIQDHIVRGLCRLKDNLTIEVPSFKVRGEKTK